MAVIDNAALRKFSLPGLEHQTLAAREQGLSGMEVWMQTITPGAGTPVHRHACEEVIVVLRGAGQVTIEGEEAQFGPNSTIIAAARCRASARQFGRGRDVSDRDSWDNARWSRDGGWRADSFALARWTTLT